MKKLRHECTEVDRSGLLSPDVSPTSSKPELQFPPFTVLYVIFMSLFFVSEWMKLQTCEMIIIAGDQRGLQT